MKTNILKITAIVLILAIGLTSCKEKEKTPCDCKDELYHYESDQKTFLDDQFMNDWLLVGFDTQVQDAEIVNYLNQTGLFKPVKIRQISRPLNDVDARGSSAYDYARIFVNTKKRTTCTQLKEIISTLEKSPIVAFANFRFSFEYYEWVSFASYFYVVVKDREDLSDLYAVSQETNTTIVEDPANEWSHSFLLQTNKESKGNALQMANYFFETGKFSLTDVEWIGIYAILSRK